MPACITRLPVHVFTDVQISWIVLYTKIIILFTIYYSLGAIQRISDTLGYFWYLWLLKTHSFGKNHTSRHTPGGGGTGQCHQMTQGGSKIGQKSVTYYLNGPLLQLWRPQSRVHSVEKMLLKVFSLFLVLGIWNFECMMSAKWYRGQSYQTFFLVNCATLNYVLM